MPEARYLQMSIRKSLRAFGDKRHVEDLQRLRKWPCNLGGRMEHSTLPRGNLLKRNANTRFQDRTDGWKVHQRRKVITLDLRRIAVREGLTKL